MRRSASLRVQCPSVSHPAGFDDKGLRHQGFSHEACGFGTCHWYDKQALICGARTAVQDNYREHLDKDPVPPDCPLASQCHWHLDAIAVGEQACPPRRLGLLCEHQGGEWNTFDMADPEDWK